MCMPIIKVQIQLTEYNGFVIFHIFNDYCKFVSWFNHIRVDLPPLPLLLVNYCQDPILHLASIYKLC